MFNSSTVPLFHGLLAKAGISKARQISSPFNVQHDVHISVEDLDDIMQQVPDSWKPYISPARSPLSAHHSTDEAAEDGSGPPLTPIYAAMTTSAQRRSTSASDDGGLAGQLGQLGLSGNNRNSDGGADTPGWLPRIVSVCSPPETMPSMYHSKLRALSDLELDSHARRASADFQAPRASTRHGAPSTPTSAPMGAPGLPQGGPPPYNLPDSPVSTRSAATTTVTATTTKTKATAVTYAENTNTSPSTTQSAVATSKWIKRKSRILPSTLFSVVPPSLALAIAEEEDDDEVAATPATTAAVAGSGKMPNLGIDNGGLT
ncbi:hypothetical protein LPJ71_007980, partial [Coemansia sp. S17]